jgi:hypothetical protein
VIADNTVRLRALAGTKNARGISLFGNAEDSGPGVVIRNNRVELDAGNVGTVRPLVVNAPSGVPSYDRLIVENNDLEGSAVHLLRTMSATVRANRFVVDRVWMPNASSGTFQENRVRGRDTSGLVELVNLSGTWLVDHNECATLQVLPVALATFVLDNAVTTFPNMTFAMLAEATRPASGAVERTLRAAFRGLGDTAAPAGMKLIPSDDDAVVAGTLTRDVAIEIGEILDDLAAEAGLEKVFRELTYRAHVADNVVSSSLFVGNSGLQQDEVIVPSSASWVQVLGNQVGNMLSVGNYTHLIVANNLAANLDLTPPGSSTAPIVNNNHNA